MATRLARQRYLIEKRALALAVVHLTRRPDLTIIEPKSDDPFDLLVSLPTSDIRRRPRQFAVAVTGSLERASAGVVDGSSQPSIRKLHQAGPFSFPVILFDYSMREDSGSYTWIVEPAVTPGPDSRAELVHHDEVTPQTLDDVAVDQIIDRVSRWYEIYYDRSRPIEITAVELTAGPAPKSTRAVS